MPGKILDNFCQWAALSVSVVDPGGSPYVAAGQLVTGLSNLQKIAWAVSRIEYEYANAFTTATTVLADYAGMGITASGSTDQSLDSSNPSLYDFFIDYVVNTANAVTPIRGMIQNPLVHDYGINPILVLPQNLYLMVKRYDAAAVSTTCRARIYYKEVELGPENWYDLLQLRLPLGAV